MWMEGLEEMAETRRDGMKTDRDANWQGLAYRAVSKLFIVLKCKLQQADRPSTTCITSCLQYSPLLLSRLIGINKPRPEYVGPLRQN